MVVHEISGAPEMTDVLLWDAMEREWRIGHGRALAAVGGRLCWCACTVREGDEIAADEEPIIVFTQVTHWSPLPPEVEPGGG